MSTQVSSEIEGSLGIQLVRAHRSHHQWAARALAALGLYPGQEVVLAQLWREAGLTQSELAARVGIEPPTVTRMLQRLERAGLVERRPCADDARVSRVHLTVTGQALEPAVRDVWRRLEERTVAGLSDAEQIVLRRLLQQVQGNLDEGP